MAPVWDRDEDFVIWGDTHPTTPYNGSMFLLRRARSRRCGTRSIRKRRRPRAGRRIFRQRPGLDCILSGAAAAALGQADGVYSYRVDIKMGGDGSLPKGARIVMFHGTVDPWSGEAQRLGWVREHYR
jgi:hypothetical protein